MLWYQRPATEWVEALPVGNGRLGAMVWGGLAHERLQLNEDTLYAGGPYDATNPQALATLPMVRELVFGGRYAEAEKLADEGMLSRPLKRRCRTNRWPTCCWTSTGADGAAELSARAGSGHRHRNHALSFGWARPPA